LKKLQVSLSDFRRLCILKGIYPREPTNKKKANKGSSAPASFYYSKDILYLLHEPLLAKFREHKTFAKKLARALGRGEWALAKGLEERKPVARLDHLVKERYPTFGLALKDLNDPLSLLSLFMGLPTNPVPGRTTVPPEVIAETGRLVSEWKVWAIRTHSLRKVFLSIKGVYYECEVPSGGPAGEMVNVRWLEPWEFTQQVPTDVDFRILLTFLDLYRTLVSFVLYKLYTDENLVYPPTLDVKLDESGEGVGKFKLEERAPVEGVAADGAEGGGKKVTKKEVRRGIRAVAAASAKVDEVNDDEDDVAMDGQPEEDAEEFVHHPSKNDEDDSAAAAPLPTYTSLLASAPSQQPSTSSLLFSAFTFYLSRETSSRTWEFVIRAFGGRVVTSLGASDIDNVTHVLIDRPVDAARMREMENGRKWVWVQPQWVADCVNQKALLPSGPGSGYEPGATLPPHLSPWAGEGEVDRPWAGIETAKDAAGEEDEVDGGGAEEDKVDDVAEESTEDLPPALVAAAQDPTNESLLHAAELEAEANATPHATFRNQLKKATAAAAKSSGAKPAAVNAAEEDLRKIMMTGKKQKLYEKMQYSNNEKKAEKAKLEQKRQVIEKRKAKEAKAKALSG